MISNNKYKIIFNICLIMFIILIKYFFLEFYIFKKKYKNIMKKINLMSVDIYHLNKYDVIEIEDDYKINFFKNTYLICQNKKNISINLPCKNKNNVIGSTIYFSNTSNYNINVISNFTCHSNNLTIKKDTFIVRPKSTVKIILINPKTNLIFRI